MLSRRTYSGCLGCRLKAVSFCTFGKFLDYAIDQKHRFVSRFKRFELHMNTNDFLIRFFSLNAYSLST